MPLGFGIRIRARFLSSRDLRPQPNASGDAAVLVKPEACQLLAGGGARHERHHRISIHPDTTRIPKGCQRALSRDVFTMLRTGCDPSGIGVCLGASTGGGAVRNPRLMAGIPPG
jgi:hypothetical protein